MRPRAMTPTSAGTFTTSRWTSKSRCIGRASRVGSHGTRPWARSSNPRLQPHPRVSGGFRSLRGRVGSGMSRPHGSGGSRTPRGSWGSWGSSPRGHLMPTGARRAAEVASVPSKETLRDCLVQWGYARAGHLGSIQIRLKVSTRVKLTATCVTQRAPPQPPQSLAPILQCSWMADGHHLALPSFTPSVVDIYLCDRDPPVLTSECSRYLSLRS
mmetsp:Transcript_8457/g.27613  ORF Transcript_8457/g.27613 Transcript_8457/m.27613 type:complete len:213 (-) Transcript_8457:1210-1848(-)